MRQLLRRLCKIGISLSLLIWSAGCSAGPAGVRLEPPCTSLLNRPREVRSEKWCKELEAPILINCADPNYPADAQKQRIEGKVVAKATINLDGIPEGITVVDSPSPSLTKAAVDAFSQFRYQPAFCKDSGRSVRVYVTVTWTFGLRGKR